MTGSSFFDSFLQRPADERPAEASAAAHDAPAWVWSTDVPKSTRQRGVGAACQAYLARHAVDDADALANTELIISELVANVEQHAPGPASFHLDWNTRNPRLLVLDRGPGFAREPIVRTPDPFAESGRGLAIIAALALDLQIGNRHDGGGYVCVLLPLERDT